MNLSSQRRKQLSSTAVVLLVLIIIYGGLGFFGVPWYINRTLSNYVSDSLQRELAIQKISFNPFTLSLMAQKIALLETGKEPIAGLDRLYINIDLDEIFGRNLVVSRFLVESPRLKLVIDEQGQLNIARLLDGLPEDKKDDAEGPLLDLVFESSHITGGRVDVLDNSKEQPVSSVIKDINLNFSSISTIEREEGQYRINLQLDRETEMQLQGTLSLVPIASAGQFQINELSVANAAKWFDEKLPVISLAGTAGVRGNYKIVTDDDGKPVVNIESVGLNLSGFSARDRDSDMVFSLQDVAVSEAGYAGADQRLDIGELAVSALGLRSNPSGQIVGLGSFNLEGLAYDLRTDLLEVSSVRLAELRAFRRNEQNPLVDVDRINLEAISYSTAGGTVSAGSIDLKGSKVQLETYADGRLKLPELPKRSAQVETPGAANLETGPGMRLKIGALRVSDTAVAYAVSERSQPATELLALDSVAVKQIDVDLGKQRMDIDALALDDARIGLTIDQAGKLDVLRLLAKEHGEAEKTNGTPGSSPFGYKLGKLTVSGVDIVFADNTLADPVEHRFSGLGLSVNNLSNAADARADLKLNVGMPKRGALSLQGWIEPATVRTDIKISLEDMDLTVLDPYLAARTNLNLASGTFDMSGQLVHLPNEGGFSIANGQTAVSEIRIDEASSQQKLIAAQSIAVDGAELGLDPTAIRVKLIKVVGPYANVLIDEQQNLNLLQAIKGPASMAEASTTDENKPQPRRPRFELEVERIDLEKGKMDFDDRSMTPKFAARIHDLTGTATGISSDPERYTSVALTGKVNEYGATKITADLQPFDYLEQSKISMQFQNIDTQSLSPYSAKFAGRKINSGRLSLDLNYDVVDSKLDGDNSILLESLVLGEKVDSPDAIKVDLDMALSLLQDKDGKIDINLPVSGDLNNPEFEIGAIVQKAIGNLIGGIVSAPFKFIGATFGADGEQLKVIKFEPGSAEITPPEAEKAATLSQALIQRPALTLTVSGAYDAKLDGQALARQKLTDSINQRANRKAAPINYSDPELQRVLDDLAGQRIEPENIKTLREKIQSDLANTQDDGAFKKAYYSELFSRLVDQMVATIEETGLKNLGKARASAVLGQIVKGAPAVRDRITLGDEVSSVQSEKALIDVVLEAGTVK